MAERTALLRVATMAVGKVATKEPKSAEKKASRSAESMAPWKVEMTAD